ncbi:Lon protease homolog [Durusdinium trenchii]|uniref:Mitochondrial (Lon protease-like protein) (LONP) (Mitochondrial ATP-dependent protease Lon) (Serine protease 15) n=1 Tax=Durusdinium trenchii TaxID=1381693 RepID=A0ABP0SNM2_9DINO
MNLTNFSTPAPYAPPAEEPRLVPPALRVKQPRYIPPPEVGESFWQPEAWFQIELMHDATQCLSRVADNVLMIEPCARVDAAEFQNQHFTLQRLSWCNGDQTAYQVRLGDRCLADAGDHLVLRRCDLDPAWVRLQPVISERKMVLSIHPDLQDNHRADLGETYMGNPGVHLPWDVKHLVEYPWAGDHCSAPKPLYSDPSQACYDQFKHQSQGMQVQCPAEPEDTHLLGDGKGCTGLCGVTSTDAPCSCGTMSCPGCVSGFGYNALTDSSWLPPGCIFVGCTQGADPAKPEGSYSPFLIPGGFNIRTCPSNALDGRAAWNDVARKDEAAMCAMDADCAGEEFVGRMSLSGRSFTFCCPGATSNPFSVLSLGYFGVMPENGHYGANGVECNATGCSYRRSCACPWSVPAFNLRVTGPSTRKTVFIPHPGEAESFRVKVIKTKVIEVRQLTEDPEDAQIIIAPHMDKDSKLSIYAVAMGSDDSFHVGDGVNLNPPGVAAFLQSCTLPCERRHECAAITLPHYPGFGGPQEINPSGLWNVKEAPGPSLFDDRSIVIAPKLTKSTLHMGPVFIGHPGKTYVGDDPDVRGIFQGCKVRQDQPTVMMELLIAELIEIRADVKERILEHMAVSFLKGSVHGKIMCLVGPPGVGKTSIGKSIARAIDRQFFRFSVGGLHDVSEIRGHRRTYVGAMPGKIIQALKIRQVSNPVILVDEVDKLGRDFRGDPSSALLEVLDPEQNANFRDLYLDVPFDLSKVLFICTANVTDTIPGPLLDRMEIIRLAGYVYEEKLAIANQYLIPQTIASNGVAKDMLDLQPEALAELIRNYAREAGVRELRKLLEKITRKVALSMVRAEAAERKLAMISLENLRKFVGQPPHSTDRLFQDAVPSGVAMGLAWTALGGKTLVVEARGRVPASNARAAQGVSRVVQREEKIGLTGEEWPDRWPSSSSSRPRNSGPRMKVTGKLGKVMGESSEIALTYAKIFLRELSPQNDFLDTAFIHMNMPEGATPKERASEAGWTICWGDHDLGPVALARINSDTAQSRLSMALDRPVKRDLAMSGEARPGEPVTLTGKVLRVGGIKEHFGRLRGVRRKTLAAKRENVENLVLPMSNQADYLELKPYLRAGLTAHFVDHFDDVYRLAFEDTGAPMLPGSRGSDVVTVKTPIEAMSAGWSQKWVLHVYYIYIYYIYDVFSWRFFTWQSKAAWTWIKIRVAWSGTCCAAPVQLVWLPQKGC